MKEKVTWLKGHYHLAIFLLFLIFYESDKHH
jgi:hypothetical protein